MLRTMREAAGITQQDFARVLGISAGHLSHIEKGNRPLTRARLALAATHIAAITRGDAA